MQPVDLAAIVVSAIDVVSPTATAKGITLASDITTDEPWVMGDEDRLQQIVWNLLSNAIKFTESGGRVALTLSRTKEAVTLAVDDTGRGIDPEFLPQMFERFRQADPSSSRRHGGLGLGLSLVRTLTELHGGTVAASSTPNVGSRFVVVLPGLAELVDSRPTLGVEPDLLKRLKGLRVLIVEDDREAREIFVAVLHDYGVEILEAASTGEAIAKIDAAVAADRLPDAIISDIALPGQDGYRLIEILTARPASLGGSIPVIAVTAYGRPEDKRRALAAGFRLHITKPVEPLAVAAAVASVSERVRE
jgi:CheY-like chemotaxis protein